MVRGKALEVKAYTQGGSRGSSTVAPRIHLSYSNPGSSCRGGSSYDNGSSRGYEERTYGYGGSGVYGNFSKRGRYDDGPPAGGQSQDSTNPQAMLAQMKQMMNQMQQMQKQMIQMT